MKKSELRRLVGVYREVVRKQKRNSGSPGLAERRGEIERRYFHETGRSLEADLGDPGGIGKN